MGGSGPGGGGTATAVPIRQFAGDEGYAWHEEGPVADWAVELPKADIDAINAYAGFEYGDINKQLRGQYEPHIINEFVRPATPDEIAAYDAKAWKSGPNDRQDDDPRNKVEDGRIVHNVYTRDPEGKAVEWSIQRAVPDAARVKDIETTANRINESIRERGYELPEPMEVKRAAYIPGLSFEDLKAQEGAVMEEKGFTSTMVGNPSNRLDAYVANGKHESIYNRTGGKQIDNDEVGTAMRITVILPEGTKVAAVEPVRRIQLKYPRIQDPSVDEHPEWLEGGLKREDYTIPDTSAKPTVRTQDLQDKGTRREAEILLGSGAQFRVVSVEKGKPVPPSPDGSVRGFEVADVLLEYVGGGSSAATGTKSLSDYHLGGAGSGNFGHAGRPGEVGGSAGDGAASAKDSGDEDDEGAPAREAKLEAFHALLKESAAKEASVDTVRTELNDAWKVWMQDVANHKPKPLKPDGAAAKRLESYKNAQAIEAKFHAQYEEVGRERRALEQQAREMLKVPKEDRSRLTFEGDTKNPLHPAVADRANRALATMRQFDGSGAFQPISFPADKVEKFREVFGDNSPLVQNEDGSFSIPSVLKLGKAASGRSNATLNAVNIGSGGGDLESHVYHEVAHHIEMKNPRVLAAAIALREKLADQPREVYSLYDGKRSLEKDEKAVRGNFPDPYSGKIYPHDLATEIVSTGVESYMLDPINFARSRPEHFQFIFDVLHGKFR